MSKEAMKLALEALEGLEALLLSMGLTHLIVYGDAEKAITSLSQAIANEVIDRMAENARELGLDYEPAQQQEPVGTVQCINGVTIGYLDVMQPVGTKLYTSLQPAQPSKPLPFNKEDMEGLDVNQRLGFKLGWKSAEEAHGIKENT